MTQAEITRYILDTFEGVSVVENADFGGWFFFHGDERMFPFATIVDWDNPYDDQSRLDRGGLARLNIGLTPRTFKARFGGEGYDYTAVDALFPHPVYAKQRWVSVINPGPGAWPEAQELLAEAYQVAVAKQQK